MWHSFRLGLFLVPIPQFLWSAKLFISCPFASSSFPRFPFRPRQKHLFRDLHNRVPTTRTTIHRCSLEPFLTNTSLPGTQQIRLQAENYLLLFHRNHFLLTQIPPRLFCENKQTREKKRFNLNKKYLRIN